MPSPQAVIAAAPNELECPLWHGIVYCIKKFFEMPATERPNPKDCLFLTIREPYVSCDRDWNIRVVLPWTENNWTMMMEHAKLKDGLVYVSSFSPHRLSVSLR